MRRRLSLVAAVLLTSCPSSNPTLADFCNRYVDAAAARLAECNGSTADAWKTAIEGDRLCIDVVASDNAGTTIYHGELAQPCLDIVAALHCDELTPGGNGAFDIFCSATVSGQVQLDHECSADRECAIDLHCDTAASRCPGTCRALRDINDICDVPNGTLCRTGLACIDGHCALTLDAGSPCLETSDCQTGLFCDPSLMPDTCGPLRSDGPCPDGPSDCAPLATCVADGGCALAKQEGDRCTPGQHECGVFASCVSGFCLRAGGLGTPCGTLTAGETSDCLVGGCLFDAGAPIGTCVVLDAGTPCDSNAQCGRGGACLGTPQVCVPRCDVH